MRKQSKLVGNLFFIWLFRHYFISLHYQYDLHRNKQHDTIKHYYSSIQRREVYPDVYREHLPTRPKRG